MIHTRRAARKPIAEAFVVWVDGTTGGAVADVRGRVEHAASGAETQFDTARELAAFMERTLRIGRNGQAARATRTRRTVSRPPTEWQVASKEE